MNDLHILNFRLVDSIPTEKPHYVYTVDVQVGGRHRCVEKRYSQFHSLHRQLRKEFQTPSFPPKRVRCSQPRLLEQRRRGLELYLRTLFQQSASCQSQILTFLGLPKASTHGMCTGNMDGSMGHQPVFIYRKDPYMQPDSKSDLPDVVVSGMLMALYDLPSL
ncbi:sorting nexin-24-like [Frankliniella occidentalis]|uniref:Sorting nexin-24-like n=1 Tax=Frankliniella occidentalis TaxID=133901 RepID=A0A6J1SX85_FRAOC|nr:sorting nexin-24-like [Frankliniella occidentalis]XP_026285483.1 sorting nexin-24-like [Frankliniella occidentalis]